MAGLPGPARLGRRLAETLLALILLALLAFALPRLAAGDPSVALYGAEASAADRAALRASLGLDRPLSEQLVSWAAAAARGDLGQSLRTRQPALQAVLGRVPATAALALAAVALALPLGVGLGAGCALGVGRVWGRLGVALAAASTAAPGFWVGLLLVYVFAFSLGVLPFGGLSSSASSAPLEPGHLVLPTLALSLREIGRIALLVRSGVLDALAQPYARVASAKGLSASGVVFRHALPNALLPVIGSAGVSLSYLLAGAIAIETVFAWPGLGRLMAESAASRDFPVLAAGILTAGVLAMLVTLLCDLGLALLDPTDGDAATEVE